MTDLDRRLEPLIGPYERWAFGEPGRHYSLARLKAETARRFAALAEVPSSHRLLQDGHLSDPQWEVRTPTLWRRAFPPKGSKEPCFVPMILDVRATKAELIASFRQIHRSLLELTGPRFLDPTSAGPLLSQGFRVNAPMPDEAIDLDFPESGREPAHAADPEFARMLETEPSSGAPLVVVGVIDDGLPFAHRSLRDRHGRTRMEFCWLQSADVAKVAEQRTVLFGREHTRHTIAELIERHRDEDALYREAGLSEGYYGRCQPPASLLSHGAHVLDLAAGRPRRGRPEAQDVDRIRIIGVELPAPVTMDSVGFGKDAFVLGAMHYIFDRADRIERAYGLKAIPLVINLSFGFTGGPHDGNDRLEAAISGMVAARRDVGKPTALVMPAGNTFSSALHCEISRDNARADDTVALPWRIQPNDHTSNYLEIWFPEGRSSLDRSSDDAAAAGDAPALPVAPAKLRILDPFGRRVELAEQKEVGGGSRQTIWDMKLGGEIIGQASIDHFRALRWRLTVILAPTEPENVRLPVAPAGLWRVEFEAGVLGTTEVVSSWIQRDESLSPRNGILSRQSYFDDPRDVRFGDDGTLARTDSKGALVSRFHTLNGLATHDNVIVIAGTVEASLSLDGGEQVTGRPEPTDFSAAGGSAPGTAGSVDGAAPSDDSSAVRGRLAAGARSGSAFRLRGTSAAAPQVSRAVATAWLKGEGSRNELQRAPHHTLRGIAVAGLQLLDHRGGAGRPEERLEARLGKAVLVRGRS